MSDNTTSPTTTATTTTPTTTTTLATTTTTATTTLKTTPTTSGTARALNDWDAGYDYVDHMVVASLILMIISCGVLVLGKASSTCMMLSTMCGFSTGTVDMEDYLKKQRGQMHHTDPSNEAAGEKGGTTKDKDSKGGLKV